MYVALGSVHAPPGVVMVAPPEVPRNASQGRRAKAAPMGLWPPGAAEGSIKAGALSAGSSDPMIDTGAAGPGGGVNTCVCPPHRVYSWSHHRRPKAFDTD
jgi:hypothetical protein